MKIKATEPNIVEQTHKGTINVRFSEANSVFIVLFCRAKGKSESKLSKK